MIKWISGKINAFVHWILYDVNLKPKLTALFIAFSILPLLLTGILSCSISSQYVKQSEYFRLQQAMYQMTNTIDYFLSSYTSKCEMLSNNTELQKLLYTPTSNIFEEVQCYTSVKRIISQVTEEIEFSFSPFSEFYSGNIHVELYVNEPTIPIDDALIKPIEDYTGQNGNHGDNTLYRWRGPVQEENYEYIALDRDLYYYSKGAKIGVVRFLIPVKRLDPILRNDEAFKYSAYIADANLQSVIWGDSILHEKLQYAISNSDISEGVDTLSISSERMIVGLFTSPVCGWKILCAIPQHEIISYTRYILTITALAIVTSLFLGLCFLVAISKGLTSRMELLYKKTTDVREGNLIVSETMQGHDEIAYIDQSFNEMVYQLNKLIEQEYKAELRSNKAAMELLQEQINPHLLYNSLSMIAHRAKEQGATEIEKTVQSMILFYRDVLNRGSMITTLQKEINIVEEYLSLVRFVYDLDIDSSIDVDACIMDKRCIKMLLQPIVENAVLHGLRPYGGGMLCISGEQVDGKITLEVINDGYPLSDETLNMLDRICAGEQVSSGGYALGNIVSRLRLYYSDSFSIKFVRLIEGGTSVRIEFKDILDTMVDN